MLTITEYLEKIFEEFKGHCDGGTQSMWKLSEKTLKKNSPIYKPDEPSLYSSPARQQLYLLQYAHEYGFEYLSMYNEFIEDFADKEEISVVSLGCGTMLDYWALACILDKRKVSRPVVNYLGIDALKWNHSLEIEARDRDTVRFSQESFENFFRRQNNGFNTHDVYFFPKSISEFSDKKEQSDIEMMLNSLSGTVKDTIYLCITLRKSKNIANSDAKKVKKIIDKLEKTGFHSEDVKCIADKNKTIDELKECLGMENITPVQLGKNKDIGDTDFAKRIGYPKIPKDDPINDYIKKLNKKCVHSSPEKDEPCGECKHCPCGINKAQRMKNTKYICDLIMKFKRG